MAAQGCPNKTFETFGVPSKRPKSTKRAPKRPPGAPKRSPREPPNTLKGIFQSQTLIFLESSPRRSEIKVFVGRRGILEAQNRHHEAPRETKEPFKMHGFTIIRVLRELEGGCSRSYVFYVGRRGAGPRSYVFYKGWRGSVGPAPPPRRALTHLIPPT